MVCYKKISILEERLLKIPTVVTTYNINTDRFVNFVINLEN